MEIKYRTFLPKDRVFIDGVQSRVEFYIMWILTSNLETKSKFCKVISVESSFKDYSITQSKSTSELGTKSFYVPTRVDVITPDKSINVVF